MSAEDPRPADFDLYRAQITGCHCDVCNEVAFAMSDVLDFGRRRHLAAACALLAALKAGTHRRKTFGEYADELAVAKAERLAQARAEGASAATLEAIERGYVAVRMRDFYASGMGLGVGGRV